MNITTQLQHQTHEFHIYEISLGASTVSVVLNFETGRITVSPYQPLPRGQFTFDDWIFDNIRFQPAEMATLAGLAVLMGEPA